MEEKEKNIDNKKSTNNKENKTGKVKLFILIVFSVLSISLFLGLEYIVISNVRYKPIIYLYPTQETEVTVSLGYKDKLTSSYPKYEDSWKVLAKPSGDLTYLKTNQKLYSLYYESNGILHFKVEKDGFCVKGEEVAKFLEEKLAKLGLTERESEEFIIYWLPKLENNKYNYIRFATSKEIDIDMPLNINPKPDNTIRVLMTFKGLKKPIDVQEQSLTTPKRTGFVAVEWGGTEIK